MCEYCESGMNVPYKISRYLDINISTVDPFVNAALVVTNIRKACPPFARCCDKDMNISVVFGINFCPNCGRDLRKRPTRGCRRARGQICHCWDGFECTRSEIVQENEERCPCDEEARNVSES